MRYLNRFVWYAPVEEKLIQLIQNLLMLDAACHMDRKKFTGIFINNNQEAHSPAICGPDQNLVIAPYMIFFLGTKADA